MSDSQNAKFKVLTKAELLFVSGGEAAQGSGIYSAQGLVISPNEAAQGSGKPK